MPSKPKLLSALFLFAGVAWLLIGLGQLGSRDWIPAAFSLLGGVSFLASGIAQRRIAKGGK